MRAERTSCPDRFIPTRSKINFQAASWKVLHAVDNDNEFEDLGKFSARDQARSGNPTFLNIAKKMKSKENYQNALWSVMFNGDNNINGSVFKYNQSEKSKNTERANFKATWPVIPRKRPCIGPPTILLDLPDITTIVLGHRIDWGKQGQIATIFKTEVFLWSEIDNTIAISAQNENVGLCAKWNKSGTYLAVIVEPLSIQIMYPSNEKIGGFLIRDECCNGNNKCLLTVLEWKNEDILTAGCNSGHMSIFRKIHDYHYVLVKVTTSLTKSAIVHMKFSCKENFLALSNINGYAIIYRVNGFDTDDHTFEKMQILRAEQRPIVQMISWHPWKDYIIGVADRRKILMWDLNSQQCIDYYEVVQPYTMIYAISFCPLTAELVYEFSG
ncbi:protein cortex-like isoform X2 [Cylas formicarius]|uniref:protein cortex-like isoform X2 n=1 Tax=Cylas formicarius TaxID=197179 RepID=UPI00295880C6|nr:protein cortex-like isoform X2 [Cylas formicarius]